MNISYYTIDDLRLPPKRSLRKGRSVEQYSTLEEALACYAADVLHTLTAQHQDWMAERLLEHGMPVAPDNYAALHACLNNGAAGIGKLLLDGGIDLERYQAWAEHRPKSEEYGAAMEDLAEYWAQTQIGPQQDGPFMGDMSL